jgi:hypothetical protein
VNEAFIDHLMRCKQCFGPAKRYCEIGQECKIQSDAEYVLSLPKVEHRRREMEILKTAHPNLYARTEAKVKALFEERREQVAA